MSARFTVVLPADTPTMELPLDPSLSSPGALVAPAFIDLYADLRAEADEDAARLGGFVKVLGVPDGRGSRGWRATPLVLEDGSPGDLGDSRILSAGRGGVRSDLRLDRLLQYAAGIDALVMLRPCSPELEQGALVRTGPIATRTGLPAVSPVSESIGVHRILSLAHQHGTRVHLTHVWSAAGVVALRRARAEGFTFTASTTLHHLITPASVVEVLCGPVRFQPVLGDESDQAALLDALRDGTLSAIATDHRPLSTEETEGPVQVVEPGQVGLGFAFAAVASAVGVELAARALSYGPREVLGVDPPGLVVLEPAGSTRAAAPLLGSGRNTPHRGAEWPARVRALVGDMRLPAR